MVMIMFCGFSVGAALGGMLAAGLIPYYGWRSVFIVGGVAPLIMVPILVCQAAESVRFLALHGNAPARVAECSARSIQRPRRVRYAFRDPGDAPRWLAGVASVSERRTATTLLLWVVFFMSLLDLYFLSNWLPTVLNDLGASGVGSWSRSDQCCRSAAWSAPSRSAA